MHQYKKLDVWQNAVDFAVEIYLITKNSPSEEKFGLTTQLRRAAISVASNIAEGACRNTAKEFYHFLGISSGSIAEVETQLIIASRLGMIPEEASNNLSEKATAILNKLWKLKVSLT
ncbi:four helix bundle protein [Taibaiella koreensis]|uniref:four helix bundle protein n=1 Tax=Taibaiella koreensis TaxID=1268548 RepID=UPI000E59A534|nr:four helix bundle protein [Taibaiella koreensis]